MEEPKYCVAFTADDRFCSLCNQCKGCVELAKNYKNKINTTMRKEEIYCKHTGHYIRTERSKQVFKAMEEYSQSQLSEYKQKLKAEIEKMIPRGSRALNDVLTLIDKI